MKKLIQNIRWALVRQSLEQKVMNYCKIEFRPYEVDAAFTAAMNKQKNAFMGVTNV